MVVLICFDRKTIPIHQKWHKPAISGGFYHGFTMFKPEGSYCPGPCWIHPMGIFWESKQNFSAANLLVWLYQRLTKEPLHVLLKIHDLYAILIYSLCSFVLFYSATKNGGWKNIRQLTNKAYKQISLFQKDRFWAEKV